MSLLRFDPSERREIVAGARASFEIAGSDPHLRAQISNLILARMAEAGIPLDDREVQIILTQA